MTRPVPLLAALLTLVVAAGCEEPIPGATALKPAGQAPAAIAPTPATPPPAAVSTPDRPPATPQVATPPPATPIPRVTPTTGPVTPGPSGSPGASASPSASPSPSPTASASLAPGALRTTNAVGDLAISGPGYFVLATRPDPAGTEDLLFTRHGHFVLKSEPAGALPLFRLKHADHGFYVLGFQRAGATGAPDEALGTNGAMLGTLWSDQAITAAGLAADGDRNPDAGAKLSFDFAGRLLLAGAAPRGTDGSAQPSYVAIATVATPSALKPAPGFAGIYRYAAGAGDVAIGVAVSGAGRTVGNVSLILTGKLEEL